MDPTVALEMLRRLTNEVLNGKLPEGTTATEIATAFQSLDEWLSAGGFLPAQWPCGDSEDYDDYTPDYDPGPECDDEGGMSEVEYYPDTLTEYQEDRGY